MDTNIIAHVLGLQGRRDVEGWKRMNWDDRDDHDAREWPGYAFVLLCVVGLVWWMVELGSRGAQ